MNQYLFAVVSVSELRIEEDKPPSRIRHEVEKYLDSLSL